MIGIPKDLDSLGRLVIPKELRDLYGFEKTVELIPTPEGVLVISPEYVLVKKEKEQ